MAGFANIECVIIDGYGKTAQNPIDTHSTPNHSWNAVKLNGDWFLCDATWSAGQIQVTEDDVPSFKFDLC